jgi:aminoglycoside phosphotransferase family enzyme
MRREVMTSTGKEIRLADKISFLGNANSHLPSVESVSRRETHMSWVFLADDRVYKLKKPVRFPYLDFSTLARREAACRAELRLNRRLAPDVYLGVEPLTRTAQGLAIGGGGTVVDWLVVMRRLDERDTLEEAIKDNHVETWQLDRLVAALVRFYRHATPAALSPALHFAEWRQSLIYNHRVLLDARFGLPAGAVRRIDAAQRRFLARYAGALAARVRARRIVEGHGDLRPEHIFLGDPVRIIDGIEFNRRLRMVDPFDEIAFLSVECERLGAGWIGKYVRRRIARALRDGPMQQLFIFYRCHRATLRARLAIAHLLEPNPRTPEKWPQLARSYLDLAAADAIRLERMLKKRTGR